FLTHLGGKCRNITFRLSRAENFPIEASSSFKYDHYYFSTKYFLPN
ncbi:MAG: hypothetical protein ACI90Y_001407, partial [Polaromonas sp.]